MNTFNNSKRVRRLEEIIPEIEAIPIEETRKPLSGDLATLAMISVSKATGDSYTIFVRVSHKKKSKFDKSGECGSHAKGPPRTSIDVPNTCSNAHKQTFRNKLESHIVEIIF
ncbi:hypothetical protein AVEN_65082-1 [Araneus ventricosus]|uniref:Uncharacterized protein n=1 Tax=Araneus ventricosus TaxID=182803 RepID=A0A4Y2F5W1_ARAVE|nr:hypothetical protein AVEN_65082-1 [Araneus ventricosus]